MGSLNGTLVNGEPAGAAHIANAAIRQRGHPIALSNGDTITLGSTSTVLVSVPARLMRRCDDLWSFFQFHILANEVYF
jgi:pSer/pThr/pTyr-binding forkhead associated (FHA) protein